MRDWNYHNTSRNVDKQKLISYFFPWLYIYLRSFYYSNGWLRSEWSLQKFRHVLGIKCKEKTAEQNEFKYGKMCYGGLDSWAGINACTGDVFYTENRNLYCYPEWGCLLTWVLNRSALGFNEQIMLKSAALLGCRWALILLWCFASWFEVLFDEHARSSLMDNEGPSTYSS